MVPHGSAGSAAADRLARWRPLFFEERSPKRPSERWGQVHYTLHAPHEWLDAAVARARAQGAEVHGPVRLRWMEADAYYFPDPDGHLLEITTYEL